MASARAKLAPFPGAVLWDIAVGLVPSVDFLRSVPRESLCDRNENQMAYASANAERHGISGLHQIMVMLQTDLLICLTRTLFSLRRACALTCLSRGCVRVAYWLPMR